MEFIFLYAPMLFARCFYKLKYLRVVNNLVRNTSYGASNNRNTRLEMDWLLHIETKQKLCHTFGNSTIHVVDLSR